MEPISSAHLSISSRRLPRILLAGLIVAGQSLGGCAVPAPPSAPPQAAAPAPLPIQPMNEAVNSAAEKLFQSFKMAGDTGSGPIPFVIDPLIDGSTGAQSKATRHIQNQILSLASTKYTRFQMKPFTAAELTRQPLVLIGTFNTVNPTNEMKGDRVAWWLCLALVDMNSGRIVAKGGARASLDGVDDTPLEYFRDSPAWSEDDTTSAYVKNCQKTKVGDIVDPKYLDSLLASSLIAEAIESYNKGAYQQALDLYTSAARIPGGDQLRVYAGLYMTNQKLGNSEAEEDSFRKLVDYGLAHRRLAVKFLFRPGSTVFVADQGLGGPYEMWLQQIAQQSATRDVCLEVTGHTTPTGLPAINSRLSLLRAEYVRDRLDSIEPVLATRTVASGAGSRETLVGTGRDDDSDALDRRVEFKIIGNSCAKGA